MTHDVMRTKKAIDAFTLARARQVVNHGFTSEDDDAYADGQLAGAAACYASNATAYKLRDFRPPAKYPVMREIAEEVSKSPEMETVREAVRMVAEDEEKKYGKRPPRLWPWDKNWWKPAQDNEPQNRKRDIEKAGALLLAEWERLDRIQERRAENDVT